jgi:hypothetical protein
MANRSSAAPTTPGSRSSPSPTAPPRPPPRCRAGPVSTTSSSGAVGRRHPRLQARPGDIPPRRPPDRLGQPPRAPLPARLHPTRRFPTPDLIAVVDRLLALPQQSPQARPGAASRAECGSTPWETAPAGRWRTARRAPRVWPVDAVAVGEVADRRVAQHMPQPARQEKRNAAGRLPR